jgi:hypothetical protein
MAKQETKQLPICAACNKPMLFMAAIGGWTDSHLSVLRLQQNVVGEAEARSNISCARSQTPSAGCRLTLEFSDLVGRNQRRQAEGDYTRSSQGPERYGDLFGHGGLLTKAAFTRLLGRSRNAMPRLPPRHGMQTKCAVDLADFRSPARPGQGADLGQGPTLPLLQGSWTCSQCPLSKSARAPPCQPGSSFSGEVNSRT